MVHAINFRVYNLLINVEEIQSRSHQKKSLVTEIANNPGRICSS